MGIRRLLFIMFAMVLAMPGIVAKAATWSVDPSPADVAEYGLEKVIFNWDPATTVIEILDESAIYITNPDAAGDAIRVPAIWVGHAKMEDWDPQSPPAPNTLKITIMDSNLLNDNFCLKNPYDVPVDIMVGIPAGAISIDGVPTTEEISQKFTLPGEEQAVNIPGPTSVPAATGDRQVQSIDKITLSWNGWYVGYSDAVDGWQDVADAIKIYEADGITEGGNSTAISVTVEPADPYDPAYPLRWNNKLVITPATELGNKSKFYLLTIPANVLGFKKSDEETVYTYGQEFQLIYTVAGAGNPILIPADYVSYNIRDFKGLQIKSAPDLTLADASKVVLYRTYLEEDPSNPESQAQNATPLAYGQAGTSSDGILVTFDYPMYNGPYTIVINEGAFTGGDASKLPESIKFTITGNEMPIEDVPVTVKPNNTTVDAIDMVRVYWGNMVQIVPLNQEITGTISVDGGEASPIVWELVTEEMKDDSDDGGGIDGAYYYYLQYAPETPITEGGEYKLTVAANQVSVNTYQSDFAKNNEVVVNLTVSGNGEEDPGDEPGDEPDPDAPEYLTGTVVSPANGSVIDGGIGNVTIYWPGVTLDFEKEEDIAVPLDQSLVTVYVNGELQNGFVRIFQATVLKNSNEQQGGTETTSQDGIVLGFTDMAYFNWKGEINIQIAAGAVESTDGKLSPAIDVTYYIYGAKEITSDPASGAEFEAGEAVFTISAVGGEITGINPKADFGPFYQQDVNGENGAQVAVKASQMKVENGKLVIDLSSLRGGTYSLTIPGSSLFIDENAVNEVLYVDFTVNGGETPEQPELPLASSDPADGYVDTWLNDHVSVNWDFNDIRIVDKKGISFTRNNQELPIASIVTMYIINGDGVVDVPDTGMDDQDSKEGEPNVLVVNFHEPFFETGTYQLSIAAGAVEVLVGDVWVENTAVTLTYTVTPTLQLTTIEPTVSINTEEEVITLSWDGNPVTISQNFELQISDSEGQTFLVTPGKGVSVDNDGNLVVDYSELALEDGDYTLVLVEGSVVIDENGTFTKNAQVEYSFKKSGVNNVAAEDGKWRVYNVAGVKVLETEDASELNSLENGLYIINGKKMIIRK